MFFESLAEFSLGFTYVCEAAVDVTRNVIDGSTLVFFRCFVFRVYYHRAEGVRRLVVHVHEKYLQILFKYFSNTDQITNTCPFMNSNTNTKKIGIQIRV